ncbi:ion transporter [Candidatus Magnetomorum sp. HK-1]|nr:ion transporter [Candidatus Magnetomorum sp. HK-1]
MNPSYKDIIYELMEPYQGRFHSSFTSLIVDIFIIFCILMSCLLIPLGYYFPRWDPFFWQLEIGFIVLFSIEYLIRWAVASNPLTYPFTFFAIIDFLAIMPTLLVLHADFIFLPFFRGLRLLRLLRLLKFIRYRIFFYRLYFGIKNRASALTHHYHLKQLRLLFLVTLIFWIIGSNLLYFTETRLVGIASPYSNYWQAYWHIIIVLVSGIEDKEPLSLLGRIEVSFFLIIGICFAGLVTAELVSILVKKMNRSGKIQLKAPTSRLHHHIVIIAFNPHLYNVIKQISAAIKGRNQILIVSRRGNKINIADPRQYKKVIALYGDPLNRTVLKQAWINKASRVVILSSDIDQNDTSSERDNQSLMKTIAALSFNPTVNMTVELQTTDSLRYASQLAGVNFIVSREYGERLIGQAVMNPGVTEIYTSLMTYTDDSSEFYLIPVPEELIGKTLKQAQLFFLDLDEESFILVGIDRSPKDFPGTNFKLNPVSDENGFASPGVILEKRDNLILIAYEFPTFARMDKDDLWKGRILLRH